MFFLKKIKKNICFLNTSTNIKIIVMDKKIISNKKGFTLVELMIALVVMGIILTACYQFFSSSWKLNNIIEDTNEYQSLLDESMYRVRTELADAKSVTVFDRPGDFDESTYTFDEGYIYIISNEYSGYTVYYLDDAGTLQKDRISSFTTDKEDELRPLALAAAGGATDAIDAYNDALEKAGYRVKLNYTVQDSGRTEVTVEVYKGNTAIKALSSDIVLRSATSAGTGNSIKFKTGA
jgi:prepilin-type N-terminal cleavage/methylation domain-containing protein